LRLPEHSDTHSGICQCNFGTVNLNYQLFLEIVNYVSRTLNILEPRDVFKCVSSAASVVVGEVRLTSVTYTADLARHGSDAFVKLQTQFCSPVGVVPYAI